MKKLAIKIETIRALEHVQGGAGKWNGHSLNPSCGIVCTFAPRPRPLPTNAHSLQKSCGIICFF